jgi:predicted  nucleic acid-binding Zn-ribbon protein
MIKNIFILCICVVSLAYFPQQTIAQTPDTTSKSLDTVKAIYPTLGSKLGNLMNQSASRAARIDEVETKKAEFQQKVAAMKDQKMQQFIIRFDEKIASSSSKAATKMDEAVKKLQTLLNKMKTKSAELKGQGVETTNVDKAITEAEKAIANAQTAINAQLSKHYVLPIGEGEIMKKDIAGTVQELRTDLQKTHQSVVLAKQAIMHVVAEIKKLEGQIRPSISKRPNVSPRLSTQPTNIASPSVTSTQ